MPHVYACELGITFGLVSESGLQQRSADQLWHSACGTRQWFAMRRSDAEAQLNGHRSPPGIEGQQASDFLEKVCSHSRHEEALAHITMTVASVQLI